MIFFEANVFFRSNKNLEQVGKVLSKELFGGLPFGGRENYIRDEIPTIYIEPEIMGMKIILMGGDEDEVFNLTMDSYDHFLNHSKEEISNLSQFDLGEYLEFFLRKIQDIQVMSNKEIEQYQARFDI